MVITPTDHLLRIAVQNTPANMRQSIEDFYDTYKNKILEDQSTLTSYDNFILHVAYMFKLLSRHLLEIEIRSIIKTISKDALILSYQLEQYGYIDLSLLSHKKQTDIYKSVKELAEISSFQLKDGNCLYDLFANKADIENISRYIYNSDMKEAI